MAAWSLYLHGVGNASAVALGSPMASIERDGRPWLTIDCGAEGLSAYESRHGQAPDALFITHVHLDHVGGMERLFVSTYFDPARRGKVRLYVPAPVVPLLQRRVADYPNVLAEGGVNFWDAFQLVPVGDAFWHDGVRLEVFPVRHHWPDTAFGLRLPGSVVWTGDTRPIPEMLARFADAGELVAHDWGCTAILRTAAWRTWSANTRRSCWRAACCTTTPAPPMARRCARGHRVARAGEAVELAAPHVP